VEAEKISPEDFARLPYRTRCYTILALCHSVLCIHEKGLIHADLKPENILMEKLSGGGMAPRLVDIGSAFFENEPPESSASLEGDQVYMSPEAVMFICGEDVSLTCAMDVFSMGLLIHYYMTGHLPGYGKEYFYPNEAVLDGQKLIFAENLPEDFRELLESMLEVDPQKRPSMQDVCNHIRNTMGLEVPKTAEESFSADETEIENKAGNEDESGSVISGSSASVNWFKKAGDL
jgi:serine/threonine protein kinase